MGGALSAAGPPREDVAGRIDAWLQARGLHLRHHISAARDIGI